LITLRRSSSLLDARYSFREKSAPRATTNFAWAAAGALVDGRIRANRNDRPTVRDMGC
jgi:hypothetical protein